MSTIDTLINACAAIGVNDLYRRLWRPDRSPAHYLLVARLATVALMGVAALAALMFLGGWLSPFEGTWFETWFEWVPGIFWLFGKMAIMLLLFLWFRATFPRYRYDQIMRLGWKVFIPITIVWLLVLGVAILAGLPPWFSAG